LFALTLQTQILRAAGCEIIRAEKASGSSRTGRSELQLLLEFLRPGDTLMVTRVDRLALSIKDLQDIVYALNQQGVTLRAHYNSQWTHTRQQVKPSSICWVFSLSLKPICDVNARWRGLPRRKRGACTAEESPQ